MLGKDVKIVLSVLCRESKFEVSVLKLEKKNGTSFESSVLEKENGRRVTSAALERKWGKSVL